MNKTGKAKDKTVKKGMIPSVLKGVGAGYVITCLVFVIYALILTYTDISDKYIPIVSIICTAVSCAFGGNIASSGMKKNGLMWGVITGLIYSLILITVNMLAGGSVNGIMSKVTVCVCAMASGGIGGIIGINKK